MKKKSNSKTENQPVEKREYQTPEIKSEKIQQVELGSSCNGHNTSGGRKASGPPCTVLFS